VVTSTEASSESDDTTDGEKADSGDSLEERESSFLAFWETPLGVALAYVLLALVAGMLLFTDLSQLGIWEPWEAHDIRVAREYQNRPDPPDELSDPTEASYNWAVPTLDQQPVDRSLLKTWLLAWSLPKAKTTSDDGAKGADAGGGSAKSGAAAETSAAAQVGELEFWARAPMAAAMLLVILLGFYWLKGVYDTWSALVVSLAFASIPAVYVGVHSVAAETLFVATTTAAVICFVQLMYDDGWSRWGWGAGYGVALGLAYWDQRFFGVMVPLAVLVGFAVTQLPYHRAMRVQRLSSDDMVGRREILESVGWLVVIGLAVVWGWWSGPSGDAWFEPHIRQLLTVFIPVCLLRVGAVLARRTLVMRTFRSWPGLVGVGVAVLMIWPVMHGYAEANPTLLEHGEVVGDIPVLTYSLNNSVFSEGLMAEGHLHFAMWLRQIGFSMLPWAVLVPLGIGYAAQGTRLCDHDGSVRDDVLSPAESVKRLWLVWGLGAFAIVGAASAFGHYFYPGYLALVAPAGLMITDRRFWRRAREETFLSYAMGFVAIALVWMFTKDLARFPERFFELYLLFDPEPGLPEGFGYGDLLGVFQVGWGVMLAVFFFSLVSWGVLTVRRVGDWIKQPWETLRAAGLAVAGAFTRPEAEDESTDIPSERRAAQKREVRRERGTVGSVVGTLEGPLMYSAIITTVFVASAAAILFTVVPELGNHLSQRGVFATYSKMKQSEEKLYRYRVSTSEASVYLSGVEQMRSRGAFIDKFGQEDRFFAVVPRDDFSELNKSVRKEHGSNIPVLDARSNRLLLVSNVLREGEVNESFIEKAIVEDRSEIQHEVTFEHEGEQRHPVFDGKLKLLGYSLDRNPEEGLPTYRWGEEAELSTYFKVMESVPTSQQIFLHVDHSGNRIHGDHYPWDRDFPTDDWIEGDIVKDVYHLTIDNYVSTGVYRMYFGFYRGGTRMKVTPNSAHDGGNRVNIGKIRVAPGL